MLSVSGLIKTVKMLRELYGWTLKDAKEFADSTKPENARVKLPMNAKGMSVAELEQYWKIVERRG